MSSKKTIKAVSAPLGMSFTKSESHPYAVGVVKSGKDFIPYYAPEYNFLAPEAFLRAKDVVENAVVFQFFIETDMTPEERLAFSDFSRWGLTKAAEIKAFKFLRDMHQTYKSGAIIREANEWHITRHAKRATNTTLVNLAQRLAGFLTMSKGVKIPKDYEGLVTAYKALVEAYGKPKTKGDAKTTTDASVALKVSELGLVLNAYEALIKLNALVETQSSKMSKAVRDEYTKQMRAVIATLETFKK